MALINTATDKRIPNPAQTNAWIEVDYAFIIPTLNEKITCDVQVKLSSNRENPIGDMGQFYIGRADVSMDDTDIDAKLHAFCIEKLGSNFVKQQSK